MGIKYIRQPWYTQQLGVFSKRVMTPEEVSAFIEAVPDKFRYAEIQLNTANNPGTGNYQVNFRTNFTLDLSPSYIDLESNYHRNCRRNIQKALHNGLFVKTGQEPLFFSRFIQKNLDRSLSENTGLFETLPGIIQESIARKAGEIYCVYSQQNELYAAGWFVTIPGRCLFMVCASNPTGKKNQAMHLLVDHVIRERAGTDSVFDFTGSNIPGVAYFNTGFGATRQLYPMVKINRLPWVLRWYKR